MNHQFLQGRLGRVLLVWVVALPLASCSKNADQKAEINALRQEIQDRDLNLEATQTRSQTLEQKNAELADKATEAEQKANQLEGQLNQLKSELEVLRKAKAEEVATTSRQPPEQSSEAAKAQVDKQLAAVLLIAGDVSSGRGVVIQADGKTWLYSSPQVFSGNAKFTIKGADGTALTKMGGFQIAGDAALVRLEILQEMPVKLELDAKAVIDPATPLVAVIASSNEAAPQAVECRIVRTSGNVFEFDAYDIQQSSGCPLLSAASGKVIAILETTGAADTAPSLWPNTQAAAGGQKSRAARLNRAIDWKPVTIAAFTGERRKIEDLNKTTRLLLALAAVRVVGESLQLDGAIAGSSLTARKVLEQNAALPMVAEVIKIQTDLTGKKVNIAVRDINRRLASILGQAKAASARQVQEVKVSAFTSYHRPVAELALKWRADAEQAVTTALVAFER